MQYAQLANGLTSDVVANRFAAQQGVCQVENAINQARYDNTIWSTSSVLRHPFPLMWLQTHTATAGPQLMVAV